MRRLDIGTEKNGKIVGLKGFGLETTVEWIVRRGIALEWYGKS